MDTGLASPASLYQMPAALEVSRIGEYEVVHIGATPIAQYRISDVTARRHVMVQLAEAGRVAGQEIAHRFGVTPVYVSQLRGRYRAGGSAMLTARRRGPQGPQQGDAAAGSPGAHPAGDRAVVSRDRRGAGRHDGRVVSDRPPDPAAPAGGAAPAARERPSYRRRGAGRRRQRRHGGPADLRSPTAKRGTPGAMLLHVALAQMGLWSGVSDAGRLGRPDGPSASAQVVGPPRDGLCAALAIDRGLQDRVAPRLRSAPRGSRRPRRSRPCRTRVHALADSVDPAELMRTLVKSWGGARTGLGRGPITSMGTSVPIAAAAPCRKRGTPNGGWSTPDRPISMWHDASGRVLFFMNRPFNDQLVKGIPQLLTEIRAVAPRDPPIVLVFDRGGYSGPLFSGADPRGHRLYHVSEGAGGRAAAFPPATFGGAGGTSRTRPRFSAPRRVVYRIHEKRTRIRGAGLVRTLVVADEDAQVPVPDQLPDDGRPRRSCISSRCAGGKKTASSICRHTTASSSSFNTTRPGTGTTGSWRILAAPRCGSRSRHCRPTSC